MKMQGAIRLRFWQHVIALLALLLASETILAAAPAGVWWDANYAYRRQITLPAGTAALPTGYAVSFSFDHFTEVNAVPSRSMASGNDVRVVYWNGTTWVELDRIADPDSLWNLNSTVIWFRTQAALAANATDTSYYLYYGYSGAGTPPATTTNIFSFYDDFSAATLDTTTRWTNSGATQTGGVLTVGNGAQIRSQATFGTATIWETRAKLSSANASAGTFSYWAANSSNNNNFTAPYLRFYSSTIANHTSEDTQATTTTQAFAPISPTAYQVYSIARDSATGVRFLVNGTAVGTFTHASSTTALRILLTNATAAGATQQYTWARVRPYRNPDPTLSLAAATQLAPIGEWRLDQKTWTGAAGEVLDSSANGLNMTSFGSAATALATPAKAGNPGTCRYANLNGTNQYAQIVDNALLDLTDQVTVSVWVYPRSWPASGGLKSIVSKDDNYEFHLDPNGRVYFWWNGGGTREITSTATVPLNTWTHIAVTYKSGAQVVYINGVQRGTNTQTGALPNNALPLQIGQDQGIADRFFNGYIDEVRVYGTALTNAQVTTVMNETHPCVPEVDHFSVTHDGFGINCAVEQITVNALDVNNAVVTGFTQAVTISTGTTTGTWSLITGTGTLSATTNGSATYTWGATDAAVVFGLSYQQIGPINPSASSSGVTTGTGGPLTFHPSGFTVTSSLYTPPAAVPAFASQTAGTNFTTYITAYGTTPTDTQCGIIEAYTGAKSLKFWSAYVNPGTGTRIVAVNGSNIALTEGTSGAQTVTFINGQATVTTLYRDAGMMNISMKDDTTGNPGLPTGIRGSTGNFVVKPATFVLSNIRRTSDNLANPAASTASGSTFIAAGQSFSATVTAYESGGTVTLNFGKETSPESVALTPALVLPVGGQNPAVSATTGFGAFTNGVASGTDFSWSEVGIIALTPHIKDSDYLGAGDVIGTATGNVGRFIPNNFSVTQNVPSFPTACASGAFTYIGQPLIYATQPVLTVMARAVNGNPTQNYTGNFFKLTNTSLTGKAYSAVTGSLDTTGLPATDPVIQDLTNGVSALTFNSGTGIKFARTTPVAPITAQISLGINVIDTDGVAATNPISFSNIAFPNGAQQRYGRIAFRNAVGSELLNLPVPMRAEYFLSTTAGFVTNAAEGVSCTTGVTLSLTNFGGNLSSGETCVVDSGSPGASGVGCAAAGVVGQRFTMPPLGGDFIAILRAPGAGNDGTVTISTTVPTWLRFDWNTAASGDENPSGIATFGLFKGEAKRIFQTEK